MTMITVIMMVAFRMELRALCPIVSVSSGNGV